MHVLQQMGGRDIGHVERRVLAHQHHVDVGRQVDGLRFAQGEKVAGLAAHVQGARRRQDAAAGKRQVRGQVVAQAMAPALRLQGQGKGRIAVDVDAVDRVHLDGHV